MKRVDKFCCSDEIQKTIKEQIEEPEGMTSKQSCLDIQGNFSWGFTSKAKKEDSSSKGDNNSKKSTDSSTKVSKVDISDDGERKKLEKFVTLKDLKLSINKGEFVCIIGDVGSGKSSLLQAIIGDMIFIPQNEIDGFGGLDFMATQDQLDRLKRRLLAPNFQVDDKPIKIKGSVSYVEQTPWI